MVECHPCKVEVKSSNLLSSTTYEPGNTLTNLFPSFSVMQRRGFTVLKQLLGRALGRNPYGNSPKFPSGDGTGFVNQHVETPWVRVPPSAPLNPRKPRIIRGEQLSRIMTRWHYVNSCAVLIVTQHTTWKQLRFVCSLSKHSICLVAYE